MLFQLLKVVLLGDGACGKTSLRETYLGGDFRTNYIMTIGADFSVKEINIADKNKQPPVSRNMKFQIWDMSGQQRFGVVRKLYYRGAIGCLLVWDVSRRETFDSLKLWFDEFYSTIRHGPVPAVILGNKSDLRDKVVDCVSPEEAIAFVNAFNSELPKDCGFEVSYLETSAKTGKNVDTAFHLLGEKIMNWQAKYV